MNRRNIYKIAKNLCLDKKDIDSIMSKDVSKTGTYYWVVTAYKGTIESDRSNEVSLVVINTPIRLKFRIVGEATIE